MIIAHYVASISVFCVKRFEIHLCIGKEMGIDYV